MILRLAFAAAMVVAALWFFSKVVSAGDPVYEYYEVTGKTASELLSAMFTGGPSVNGKRAYASTTMTPTIRSTTIEEGGMCRIESFDVDMEFTVRLPRLVDSTPKMESLFEKFYEFAKRHEETHVSIWRECALESKALVEGLEAESCKEAQLRGLVVAGEVADRCTERHAELDAADGTEVMKHPFMRRALLGIGR